MITLTDPIVVPNLTRIRAVRWQPDDAAAAGVVTLEVRSPPATNRLYGTFDLVVANAPVAGKRLVINGLTSRYDDLVRTEGTFVVTSGFDQIETAYRSAANRAAAFRAVESKLLELGYVQPAGTVS
jgi:hypothetical protein